MVCGKKGPKLERIDKYIETLDAEEVPSVVKEKAGRVMGGDFSFTFGPEDDADDKVNSKLMSQIRAYKTGVIFLSGF